MAALMRPGDTAWTVVERTLEALYHDKFYVAYHGGKILVSVQPSGWHVVMLNDDAATDQLVQSPSMPTDHDDYYYKSGHVLESRGELFCGCHFIYRICRMGVGKTSATLFKQSRCRCTRFKRRNCRCRRRRFDG